MSAVMCSLIISLPIVPVMPELCVRMQEEFRRDYEACDGGM
jgi:hypothetical protein